MREIPLTQDKFALVSDIDYEYLNQWKWCAHWTGYNWYAITNIRKDDGKRTIIRMHQMIAGRLGFPNTADHKNGNGLDNRRSNLRDATVKQQSENTKLPKNNTSGHKGVSWERQHSKWRAYIHHNGKRIYLGLFHSKDDAIAARIEAEEKYFTHA